MTLEDAFNTRFQDLLYALIDSKADGLRDCTVTEVINIAAIVRQTPKGGRMTTDPSPDVERCDHCGKPEYRHVQIVGAGKVCPANCFTFSTAKSATIERLSAERMQLREALERIGHEGPPFNNAEWMRCQARAALSNTAENG